jgi:7-carboxy-7-deazaguanine synthase
MFGKNKITKPIVKFCGCYNVHSIFYTIQGEGFFAGTPSVFIRLAGCNLQCKFCDTEFEEYSVVKIEDIVNQVKSYLINSSGQFISNLVVITGGEPFLQPISELCDCLIDSGFAVQIETNGSIFREINPKVTVVCSPKISDGNYHQVDSRILKRVDWFKILISANIQQYSKVPNIFVDYKERIYLQPIDEYDFIKNEKNNRLVVDLSLKYGYKVSIQTHKILKIE